MGQIWESIKNWFKGLDAKTQKRARNVGAALLVILFLAILGKCTNSSWIEEAEATEINEPTIYPLVIYKTTIIEDHSGTALSMAAGEHHYDVNKSGWQGSISGARYHDTEAVSIGGAKRLCGTCGLTTFSATRENGPKRGATGLTASYNFSF